MALVPTWLGTQVLPWPYCTNFKGWLLCDKDSCNPTGKAVLLANMHSLNLSPAFAGSGFEDKIAPLASLLEVATFTQACRPA